MDRITKYHNILLDGRLKHLFSELNEKNFLLCLPAIIPAGKSCAYRPGFGYVLQAV